MKIMFVGSQRSSSHDRELTDFPFERAGHQLGYEAARRGHVVLIGSERVGTLDHLIMTGVVKYATENPSQQVFAEVYYPRNPQTRRIPYKGDEFDLPNLHIRWASQLDLGNEAYPHLIPHLAMLDCCDCVVALGGGSGTFIAGNIAANRRIPVFLLPTSGGSAARLYEAFRLVYTPEENALLSDRWATKTAVHLFELVEKRLQTADVAIICPLTKEREAVCSALEFSDSNQLSRGINNYWAGRVSRDEWDVPAYEIVVAQLADMGNPMAALTTARVIADWRPKALLVVGIAGGLGDATLGDVVVGSAVFYYERGKVKEGSKIQEPYMYPADARLYNRAITAKNWSEPILAKRPDRRRRRPQVHYGVIASGDKVIADEAMTNEIRGGHRKIAAIEMEHYGVSAAAWQHETPVRQLGIRGISDRANVKKSDEWHRYAAAAAASFTRDFLLQRPLD